MACSVMEEGSMSIGCPRAVEEIFKDFKGRRAGLLKALTSDVEEFFLQCDPKKGDLYLYGFPDGGWEVNGPWEEIALNFPMPTLRVNCLRDGLPRDEWLLSVAVRTDVWLHSVSCFYGALLEMEERKRLFNMINELPTLFEVVDGANVNTGGHQTKLIAWEMQQEVMVEPESSKPLPDWEEEDTSGEDDQEDSDTYCGTCREIYKEGEFWIGCDNCEKWSHGKCVKVTPARAELLTTYKCPPCSMKGARGGMQLFLLR